MLLGNDRLPGAWQTFSTFKSSFSSNPIIKAQGGGEAGYFPHVLITTCSFAVGLFIGVITGFILSLLLFQFRVVQDFIDPILEAFRVLPPLILIPFILVIFQATDKTKIFIAALYSSFSICIYILNGLQNIEKNYLFLADLFGSSKFQRIWKVEIPAVLPEALGAIRITSVLTLGIIIVAEYLGSPSGIGRILKFATSFSSLDLITVGILWVVIIAIIFDIAYVSIFFYLLKWTSRRTQI
jgi:ABC-type nitrate/sulfonate/bicarbonate transport system permease component